jgi:glycerol-3-phosphate dehydrogenase
VAIPGFDRAESLARLADETFDVVVIGGGITGAGCALDAASRGLRTALVERGDFASGTSSKSSKLVHGGIRYLQQREFGLVYEGLRERQLAIENAPHLVRVLPFLIPLLTRDGLVNRRLSRAFGMAMWAYDLTGGLRIRKLHERINRDEALAHMPTLRRQKVTGAYLYFDAHADDARLTLTIARTAAAHGAAIANYVPVSGIVKNATGAASGVRVTADGTEIEVRARAIVNATGVWADDVRALDEQTHPASLQPAKGVHVTLPWSKVRNDIAAIVPVAKDRRSIFVIPWGDFTYVGTTDTEYSGSIDDPQCTSDDVAYLLGALNDAIEEPVGPSDVLATWAGLRPLLRTAANARTADLSRRHGVQVSESGMVTITGGKLTTYRSMAEDTVDHVAKLLGRGKLACRTRKLPLLGGADFEPPAATGSPSLHDHLARRFGSEAGAVEALVRDDPTLGEALVPGLPYLRAEAVHAARHEMARTVDDVLSRRTRARLLARDASGDAARSVATVLARELGWDDAECERQASSYRAAVTHEREAAGLPETALDASLGA